MDIETITKNNGELSPYLLCWYSQFENKSYYINDYENNFSLLFEQVMKDICKKKYDNYQIYLHNMAKFDGVLFYKILVNIENATANTITNEGKLISIDFKFNNRLIHFKDSLLMLPESLEKLAISFKTENKKTLFPVFFNDINYNGLDIPAKDCFPKGTTPDEYYNYYYQLPISKDGRKWWNFREEAIKYCINDCKVLYDILIKFNKIIFDLFNMNIHKYSTISGLTLGIYINKFMPPNTIPSITGEIYKYIKKSFTGGAVDMYLPNNEPDELIYEYDVNSMYPYVMMTQDMPVGKPTWFEGNILETNPDAFGFFNCKITAPDNLENPILQVHYKEKKGIRTIAPLGTWESIYFSEEVKNAMKYGYKIEVLDGYTFERKNIFSKYIDILSKFRLNYHKEDPMNYFAKLLMTALFGRWGMRDIFDNVKVVDRDSLNEYLNNPNIIINDIIEMEDKFLIKFQLENIYYDLENLTDHNTKNISIPIASATAAYGRIFMSKFKNLAGIKLLYSDTDSLFLNKKLPDNMVSKTEIGKLKLESISKVVRFLGPKTYYLETVNGKVIIKCKGLGKNGVKELDLNIFNELLYKNKSIQLKNQKWYRSLKNGTITIKDQLYTLTTTDLKRKLIYDKNNKLIATSPIVLPKVETKEKKK